MALHQHKMRRDSWGVVGKNLLLASLGERRRLCSGAERLRRLQLRLGVHRPINSVSRME